MNTMPLLADASADFNSWLDTSAGTLVKSLFVLIGIVVSLKAILGIIQDASRGNASGIAKKIAVALVVAVFCFKPVILADIIDIFTSVVETVVGSADEVVTNNTNGVDVANG